MKEIDLAGIYIAPFAAYLIVTVIIFVPLHKIFDRLRYIVGCGTGPFSTYQFL